MLSSMRSIAVGMALFFSSMQSRGLACAPRKPLQRPLHAGAAELLVCDEGHRLKAAGGNKTINALLALRCPRRILVTGTPLQNNLEEFYGARHQP